MNISPNCSLFVILIYIKGLINRFKFRLYPHGLRRFCCFRSLANIYIYGKIQKYPYPHGLG
ncbi:hypothetical protein HMPREF2534_00421 [Bacteroides thetaiotaomicron]|nr:hypothetical protein HMPREF2534_00421 [Bacteroides thetaiotaomicron]